MSKTFTFPKDISKKRIGAGHPDPVASITRLFREFRVRFGGGR